MIKFDYSSERQVLLQGSPGSCGWDIKANEGAIIPPGERACIGTGVRMTHCPMSCYLRMAPRSGLAYKHGIDVMAGVIDSDYRGEIKVILQNHGKDSFAVAPGDRIAQLIPTMVANFTANVEQSWVERGEGAFGSTGKQ